MWDDEEEPWYPQHGSPGLDPSKDIDVDIDKALYGDTVNPDFARAVVEATWKPQFPEVWDALGQGTGLGDHADAPGGSLGDMLGR